MFSFSFGAGSAALFFGLGDLREDARHDEGNCDAEGVSPVVPLLTPPMETTGGAIISRSTDCIFDSFALPAAGVPR
ncbi:MAG TPA: hypothetical protein VIL71_02150 [Spirillospora sp.]